MPYSESWNPETKLDGKTCNIHLVEFKRLLQVWMLLFQCQVQLHLANHPDCNEHHESMNQWIICSKFIGASSDRLPSVGWLMSSFQHSCTASTFAIKLNRIPIPPSEPKWTLGHCILKHPTCGCWHKKKSETQQGLKEPVASRRSILGLPLAVRQTLPWVQCWNPGNKKLMRISH